MTDEPDALTSDLRAVKPKFLTRTTFTDFNLPAEVLSGLSDAGFTYCTPIQAQTLPVSLAGRDIAGQAQTGTGKTAAFLVTLFARLLTQSDRKPGLPAALIVAPTRELANQIYEEALVLGRHTTFKIAQVVGGIDYQRQAEILKEGVDVVICTPGRVIDYFKQGIFKTDGIKLVVIDEADRLLDLGFAKDMRYILKKLPRYDKRQSMLFSATLSYRVLELTYEYMNLPEFISITPEEVTVEGIDQELFHVGREQKLSLLLGILEREDWNRMLIFTNTKAGVEWLTQKLKGNKCPAEGITGDLHQRKRFQLMEKFKNGRIKILVATDVASRGIHVEDISHVVNYDLPQDAENYIHRIGRTARAGKTGRALSLACEQYVFHLEAVEELLGNKIPVVWPEDDWYVADKSGPVTTTARKRQVRAVHGRERVQKRLARKRPAEKPWPKKHPGAFFGFPPETPAENQAPAPAADKEASPAPRKKKRRRRRKKKPSPAETAAPVAEEPSEQQS
jgi:ATP-dependent RNA helicase RhlB